jgi:hypothetical protein
MCLNETPRQKPFHLLAKRMLRNLNPAATASQWSPNSGTDMGTEHTFRDRPDTDGLRAIAVSAVVLFHAGVPGFSGGFIA